MKFLNSARQWHHLQIQCLLFKETAQRGKPCTKPLCMSLLLFTQPPAITLNTRSPACADCLSKGLYLKCSEGIIHQSLHLSLEKTLISWTDWLFAPNNQNIKKFSWAELPVSSQESSGQLSVDFPTQKDSLAGLQRGASLGGRRRGSGHESGIVASLPTMWQSQYCISSCPQRSLLTACLHTQPPQLRDQLLANFLT
jgi:hypothetical protein